MRIKPLNPIALAENDPTRALGVHASDIYGSLYQRLEPKRYAKDEPMDWNLVALGLAWEQYLERRLHALGINATRPGEFTSPHGFTYTPDLFVFNGEFRVGEIKLTTMSNRGWPKDPKFDKWMTQVKLYCHELQTPYATFYPIFVRNGTAKFCPVDVEFSQRELRDNFQTLMSHARSEGLL